MRARLLAIVLATAALLAGCVTSAPESPASTTSAATAGLPTAGVFHLAGGILADAAATNMSVALGGEYLTGFDATEPTLGIGKDGAVYMTAEVPNPNCSSCPTIPYATFTKGPTVVKTTDKGQTWKDVYPKLPTGDSQRLRTWDPYVYVDGDTGRIFIDDIYPISCGSISWSDDGGASWTTNPYSCGNTQVNDHQTLVAAKAHQVPMTAFPNVLYRCVNDLAITGCAMSYTGGLSFTPQVPVFVNNVDGCSGLTGHLRADKDGTVYLPKADCPGGPKIKYTQDDGLSWQTLQIKTDLPMDDHELGFAVDEAGSMFATFQAKGHVWLASSTDKGKTWTAPRDVTAPGVTATQFNTVVAGAAGRVALAYIGTTVVGGYDNKSFDDGTTLPTDAPQEPKGWENATWNAYEGILVDATNPGAVVQSVTANDPMDPLARGFCGGSRCHGMNDFIEGAMDKDGRPWFSFVDVCTAACVKDVKMRFDEPVGFVATLQSGPALKGANATLPVIAAPPVVDHKAHEAGGADPAADARLPRLR
jgi:hypothetical protein